MKSFSKFTCLCFGVLGLAGHLRAELITFDDLPATSAAGAAIPSGYAGFTWNNFDYQTVMNSPALNPSGYVNGMVSAGNVAFNGFGNPSFVNGTTFNLVSGYLTGAWLDDLSVQVIGFVGSSVAYDKTYTVNSTGPTFINFNYPNVNEVEFTTSGGTTHGYPGGFGTQFVLDNLTITGTPEPSPLFLAIPGALALALARWRSRTPHSKLLPASF